jgi:hypothetical protein
MKILNSILREAAANVDEMYFHFRIDGGDRMAMPHLYGESFAQLTSNFNFLILIFTAINCSYSKLTY